MRLVHQNQSCLEKISDPHSRTFITLILFPIFQDRDSQALISKSSSYDIFTKCVTSSSFSSHIRLLALPKKYQIGFGKNYRSFITDRILCKNSYFICTFTLQVVFIFAIVEILLLLFLLPNIFWAHSTYFAKINIVLSCCI